MKKILASIFILIAGLCLISAPCVFAQDCEGNFDCDQDVDGTDAAVFKEDFGRSGYSNPCDTCLDSPCPCTVTCPNYYEPCISNDDCDSGCCCDEADADRCHDQSYCETIIGSQCITSTSSTTTTISECSTEGQRQCGRITDELVCENGEICCQQVFECSSGCPPPLSGTTYICTDYCPQGFFTDVEMSPGCFCNISQQCCDTEHECIYP